jgi:hypothetical protein
MKKQKPETRYDSWEVHDNTNSSGYRKFAKTLVNRIVRRFFKSKIEKDPENLTQKLKKFINLLVYQQNVVKSVLL